MKLVSLRIDRSKNIIGKILKTAIRVGSSRQLHNISDIAVKTLRSDILKKSKTWDAKSKKAFEDQFDVDPTTLSPPYAESIKSSVTETQNGVKAVVFVDLSSPFSKNLTVDTFSRILEFGNSQVVPHKHWGPLASSMRAKSKDIARSIMSEVSKELKANATSN